MADDPNPNAPKKETVRINIPPSVPAGGGNAPEPVKRETVRINLPNKPGGTAPMPPPPPPSKPFVPPPPAPKPPGSGAPKPPTGPVKPPTGPMRPPEAPGASVEAVAPMTMKGSAPKKETARIQLPPEPKPLPKATVRMQQTQPLSQAPAAQITKAALTHAAPVSSGDGGSVPLAAAALVFSAAALLIQVWAMLA